MLSDMDQLVKIMQASVAPCLLISGYGFLLLTMTNRLGRAADRIRTLIAELTPLPPEERPHVCEQIRVLYKRCRFLQTALTFITLSIFCVALIVLLLFSSLIFQLNTQVLIQMFFASSVACLIFSLSFFMLDIRTTLQSLQIEIKRSVDG